MATAATTARHRAMMERITRTITAGEPLHTVISQLMPTSDHHYRSLAVVVAAWYRANQKPFRRADHDALAEQYVLGDDAGFYVFDLLSPLR